MEVCVWEPSAQAAVSRAGVMGPGLSLLWTDSSALSPSTDSTDLDAVTATGSSPINNGIFSRMNYAQAPGPFWAIIFTDSTLSV